MGMWLAKSKIWKSLQTGDPIYSVNEWQRKKHKNKIKINKRNLKDITTNGKCWPCLNPDLYR